MRHPNGPVRGALRRARLGLAAAGLVLAACSDPDPAPPEPPPSGPAPSFFLGGPRATRAVVDAGTVWLVDANGDLAAGAAPSANWHSGTGLTLSWPQRAGARKYKVMGRNTVTQSTAWTELLAVDAPDPLLVPTVVATGVNPWQLGLGTGGNPWSFGNHVELAVVSEGADGVIASGDLSDILDTSDEFPGLLTEVSLDPASLADPPFEPGEERGATFAKTVHLGFSEPMRTDAPPTLTSLSANLAIRTVIAHAWGPDDTKPGATPSSAAPHAFLKLLLTVKGACTELLVPRSSGDLVLLVRDASFFAAGAGSRILFLDGATGALLGEATGVASTDVSLGAVELGTELAAVVPAGSLACAIAGGTTPVPRLVSEAGSRLAVTDASPFFVGEQVAVHAPAGAAPAVLDLRTVTGVDSGTGEVVLSDVLSAGHGAESVVVPLNGLGGEVALRQGAALDLVRDTVGKPDAELFVAAPGSVMVGDTLLVDADGRLDTTADQAQATVKQVRFAPTAPAPCSLVLDLPASLWLFHGRAVVLALGDSFQVGGTRDTSADAATPLDVHADQFSPDGRRY